MTLLSKRGRVRVTEHAAMLRLPLPPETCSANAASLRLGASASTIAAEVASAANAVVVPNTTVDRLARCWLDVSLAYTIVELEIIDFCD